MLQGEVPVHRGAAVFQCPPATQAQGQVATQFDLLHDAGPETAGGGDVFQGEVIAVRIEGQGDPGQGVIILDAALMDLADFVVLRKTRVTRL